MKRQRGFSLVETMVALALGLVISSAVIQVLVSASVTSKLNEAVAQVQSAGRFLSNRLTSELNEIGRYDFIVSDIDATVDLVAEAAFLQNKPIVIPGDYVSDDELGSSQGTNGSNDNLVINLLASQDCTGNNHGYNSEFHVVNHYFVSNDTFMCTGYDGRVLRGLKQQTVTPVTITLLDNLISFQMQYGVSDNGANTSGQAVSYVTADQVEGLRAENKQVVALRWGFVIQSYQNEVQLDASPIISVLNEGALELSTDHYYQAFSKTLSLRNMKNFVRSAQ